MCYFCHFWLSVSFLHAWLSPHRREESREMAESCPDMLSHWGPAVCTCVCVCGCVKKCRVYRRLRLCAELCTFKAGAYFLYFRKYNLHLFLFQVLSHNLYTVLNIPHDPVALEEHFQDDDDGPVSNHGYMPYLNKYILDKVRWLLKSPLRTQQLSRCTLLVHVF